MVLHFAFYCLNSMINFFKVKMPDFIKFDVKNMMLMPNVCIKTKVSNLEIYIIYTGWAVLFLILSRY